MLSASVGAVDISARKVGIVDEALRVEYQWIVVMFFEEVTEGMEVKDRLAFLDFKAVPLKIFFSEAWKDRDAGSKSFNLEASGTKLGEVLHGVKIVRIPAF